DLKPDAVVIVATIKALKYNGGMDKNALKAENLEALAKGIENLDKHIENIKKFGLPIVVALNAFESDTQDEMDFVKNHCEELDCEFAMANVWAKGGEGGEELAKKLLYTLENKESHYKPIYPDEMNLADKIRTIATEIYGAAGVTYSPEAARMILKYEKMGYKNMPVCMAKNQFSLSDDPLLLGRPKNFTINVREVIVNAGAGFIVALTGTVLTMPGLPKTPAAERIDVDENGKITGLF
ncbi:MAG TPA: formate--tetrahydrofolate ligase, partial [Eubacterium sp.]|nr:formate--tetrahydrofolate ligase [Eubacterium sp.]